MTQPDSLLWDAVAKMITALGLVLGGGLTVLKYFHARKQEKAAEHDTREKEGQLAKERAKSAEVEARKPFSTKQLELYFEAAEAASMLAVLNKTDERYEPSRVKFWSLYWGPLALVEDQKVATAMYNFGEVLKLDPEPPDLQFCALDVAHACRDSVAESWKVPLPPLDRG
jgi:hypothetical protein